MLHKVGGRVCLATSLLAQSGIRFFFRKSRRMRFQDQPRPTGTPSRHWDYNCNLIGGRRYELFSRFGGFSPGQCAYGTGHPGRRRTAISAREYREGLGDICRHHTGEICAYLASLAFAAYTIAEESKRHHRPRQRLTWHFAGLNSLAIALCSTSISCRHPIVIAPPIERSQTTPNTHTHRNS